MDRNVILAFLLSSVAVFGGVVAVASDSSASELIAYPTGDLGDGYTLSVGTVVEPSYSVVGSNRDVSVTIDGVLYENVVGMMVSSDFTILLYDWAVLYADVDYKDDRIRVDSLVVENDQILLDVSYIAYNEEVSSSGQLTFPYSDVVLFLVNDSSIPTPVFDTEPPSFASEVWVRCPFVMADTPIIATDAYWLTSGIAILGTIVRPYTPVPNDMFGSSFSIDLSIDTLDSNSDYYHVDAFIIEINGTSVISSAVPFVTQTYFDEFVASIGDVGTSDSDDPSDPEVSSDSPTIDFEIFGISEIGGVPMVYIIGGLVALVFLLAIASGVRRR